MQVKCTGLKNAKKNTQKALYFAYWKTQVGWRHRGIPPGNTNAIQCILISKRSIDRAVGGWDALCMRGMIPGLWSRPGGPQSPYRVHWPGGAPGHQAAYTMGHQAPQGRY